MRGLKYLLLTAITGVAFTVATPNASAQVSVGIGVAPDCPYGYYDVAPYGCAPAGYYGPEWFNDGAFIGVGPWFHGDEHFRGHVDNHFRADHGYRGPMPKAGERAEPGRRVTAEHFRGNEMRDGRGHEVKR
ncbi:MAG TPA: hypothetical protein VGL82_00580 [Bryobacteraceae bacterium]|jgi:hypothetical protein